MQPATRWLELEPLLPSALTTAANGRDDEDHEWTSSPQLVVQLYCIIEKQLMVSCWDTLWTCVTIDLDNGNDNRPLSVVTFSVSLSKLKGKA